MLLVMAESEAASAATAASLQMSIVSFFTAPGTTATPCSRKMEAAACWVVPTKPAIYTGRSDGELAELCTRVNLPGRTVREAKPRLFLGGCKRGKPDQGDGLAQLHRRASSYTVGCASASCGTASPHRCAATFGIAAGIAAASTDIALAAHCCTAAQTAARAPRRGLSAARRRSAATSSLSHRWRTDNGNTLHHSTLT